MDSTANLTNVPMEQRRVAPLTIVLGLIFVFFCGVLVFVFAATKRANPIMLDPHGKALNSQSQSSSGKH